MARTVRLTQEGYERLQATLERERERLEEATRILGELTGSSDDYDDAGLEEAKREKARIELRTDNLEDQLARADIIEAHEVDKVDLGSVVTLQVTDTQEALDVQVVSSVEASVLDSDVPQVSDESPMGKALLGKKPGDKFDVTINSKTTAYSVVSIS